MSGRLQFCFFVHSLISDWNHSNAHFLRGLMRALMRMGHRVRCYEELGSWSLTQLVRNEGEAAIEAINGFRHTFDDLDVRFYQSGPGFPAFVARELRGADVVVIHEWNEPALVNTVLALKQALGFCALLHDSHHRAYTEPGKILRFHLHLLDGVLALGEAIRRIYADALGVERTWTFHQAADVEHFHPLRMEKTDDVLWTGNWGEGERTRELQEFLIAPARELRRRFVAHGVLYPEDARQRLIAAGIEFRGYLPNLRAPLAYAQSRLALHVPRQPYANGLSGVPSSGVFEALACGVALLSAPWADTEGLFRPGEDFLVVPDGRAMAAEMERLLCDARARQQLAASGLETIRRRHTCAHRAAQLIDICETLGG